MKSSTIWILVAIIAALLLFFVIRAIIHVCWALKDPDIKVARALGVPISVYKEFKIIWQQQLDSFNNGTKPPVYDGPYMAEWFIFCQLQVEIGKEERRKKYSDIL